MPMTVVVLRAVPARFRGFLSSCMNPATFRSGAGNRVSQPITGTASAIPSPPCTRGWALGRHRDKRRRRVSPVYAGMPVSGTAGKVSETSPPCTRGWAPKKARTPDPVAVSPVYAGMAPQHGQSWLRSWVSPVYAGMGLRTRHPR